MTTTPHRWQTLSTFAVAALSAASSLFGLFRPGHYADAPELLPRLQAIDAAVLAVAVPSLTLGLWAARRGSLRGRVAWLGALAFATYQWSSTVGTTAFNGFFLGYVALFSLSLFTLVGGVLETDAAAVRRRLDGRLSEHVYAGFLAFVAAALALLWLSEIVPATLSGTTPAVVEQLGERSAHTYVLDLGVVVPSLAVAAAWLRRGRPWGYVAAGVLLVMAALLAPVLTALTVVDATGGAVTVTGPLLVGTVLPPAVGAAFALKYLLAMGRADPSAADAAASN